MDEWNAGKFGLDAHKFAAATFEMLGGPKKSQIIVA